MSYDNDELFIKSQLETCKNECNEMKKNIFKKLDELEDSNKELKDENMRLWKHTYESVQNVELDMKTMSVKLAIMTTTTVMIITAILGGLANMFMK